jgi:hypothetical protein
MSPGATGFGPFHPDIGTCEKPNVVGMMDTSQARATLGNRQYPPLDPAPGRYVFE